MDPRLVSTIFVALGFADLAMMNFVLAPRLAADEVYLDVGQPCRLGCVAQAPLVLAQVFLDLLALADLLLQPGASAWAAGA